MSKQGPKLTSASKYLLGFGTATTAAFLGLSFLDLLKFDVQSFVTGFTFVIMSLVIFSEVLLERHSNGVKLVSVPSVMSLTIALFSFVIGVYIILFGCVDIPLQFKGVIGILYLIDAVIVIVEMKR